MKRKTEKRASVFRCSASRFLLRCCALDCVWRGTGVWTLFYLMEDIPVFFQVDALGSVFASFTSIVWASWQFILCLYGSMRETRRGFSASIFWVYGVLIALDFAGNLVTCTYSMS